MLNCLLMGRLFNEHWKDKGGWNQNRKGPKTDQGISGAPQDNNIMLWNAVIFGLDDTPWDLQTIHPTMLISILTFYLFIFHVVYICHLENNSTENFNSLFIFVFFSNAIFQIFSFEFPIPSEF
ncbi:hypothetical protein V6Z12_D05G357100 [Gossypium hirsutum]